MGPLSQMLVAAIDDASLRAEVEARALEPQLAKRLEAARAAWPNLHVSDATVLTLAGKWIAQAGRADVFDEQPNKLDELYLACACDAGDAAALRAFEARYFAPLGAVFGRMKLSPTLADEARQQLRVNLLVGTDGASRIGHYATGGDLQGLVRVAATRAAISLLRKQSAERVTDDDDLVDLISPSHGPEVRLAKTEHREALRTAMQSALAALDKRDRTILRLHLIDRLNIDEIGNLYRVHRATAARWLERIREELEAAVRKTLVTEGRVAKDELQSLLEASHSQLELSLERLLSPTRT